MRKGEGHGGRARAEMRKTAGAFFAGRGAVLRVLLAAPQVPQRVVGRTWPRLQRQFFGADVRALAGRDRRLSRHARGGTERSFCRTHTHTISCAPTPLLSRTVLPALTAVGGRAAETGDMQPCFADLRSRSAINANLWSCLRSDCCSTWGA